MKKIYTMIYHVNGFDYYPEDFTDTDVLFEKDFKQVYNFLNEHEFKVDDRIVQILLDYAKSQRNK